LDLWKAITFGLVESINIWTCGKQ